MNDFQEQVWQGIAARGLFRRNQRILAAVSGGPDSMVLLHLLARFAPKERWKITVAHFNHGLRGRASDADEQFVKRAAAELRLPFFSECGDTRATARASGFSLEMAARRLRHEFIARAARKGGITKVALGHTADDQVELFFLRLLRGAGAGGLAGMKWSGPSPANPKLTLVRPLLNQPKSEILAFAKSQGIQFRHDQTNHALDIPRNRVRQELLPLLTTNYQPALTRVILRQMEILSAESGFLEQAAEEWLGAEKRETFELLPVALQRRIIQVQLFRLDAVGNFDLVEHLRENPKRAIEIAPGKAVTRDLSGLVRVRDSETTQRPEGELELNLDEKDGKADFAGVRLNWSFCVNPGMAAVRARPAGLNCEYFDAAAVGSWLRLRHWHPGDVFQPIGMKLAVKLQDLFTNSRVPRAERHRRVIAVNPKGRLVWVEGLRISEEFKVAGTSRRCLQWRWDRL